MNLKQTPLLVNMTSRGKLYFFEFAIQEDFMESSTSSQATVYQSYKQVFPKEEGSIFSNTRKRY